MSTSMAIAGGLAKSVFEIAIPDGHGNIIERKRLSRSQFQRYFQNPGVRQITP